jgi:Rrf2 family transcriptional regulator, iron-sulfur cluster assembly transcription factor
MRLTTKSRFALNALIDLAQRQAVGPVSLASIGQRQAVSLSYLEQLFSRMRRVGLVESTRGPGGGYALGRDASAISVADIVEAVEDPLEADGDEARSMGQSKDLWLRLHATMLEHLSGVALHSLVLEQAPAAAVGSDPGTPEGKRRLLVEPRLAKPVRAHVPNSVFAFGRSFAT